MIEEDVFARENRAEKLRMEQLGLAEKFSLETKRQESRFKQLKLVLTSAALAVVTGITSLVASQWIGLESSKHVESIFTFGASKEMFASKSDLESIKAQSELIKDALKKAAERTSVGEGDGASVRLEISVISAKLAEIEKRLATMEKSISDNPEKALSVPMLRKDQDNLSKTFDANRIAFAAEIARVNDLQKWILGGIGSVLVAVIAGLFTFLFTILSKGRGER